MPRRRAAARDDARGAAAAHVLFTARTRLRREGAVERIEREHGRFGVAHEESWGPRTSRSPPAARFDSRRSARRSLSSARYRSTGGFLFEPAGDVPQLGRAELRCRPPGRAGAACSWVIQLQPTRGRPQPQPTVGPQGAPRSAAVEVGVRDGRLMKDHVHGNAVHRPVRHEAGGRPHERQIGALLVRPFVAEGASEAPPALLRPGASEAIDLEGHILAAVHAHRHAARLHLPSRLSFLRLSVLRLSVFTGVHFERRLRVDHQLGEIDVVMIGAVREQLVPTGGAGGDLPSSQRSVPEYERD